MIVEMAVPATNRVFCRKRVSMRIQVSDGFMSNRKLYTHAITELQVAVDLSKRHEVPWQVWARFLGESGRRREATEILEELTQRSQRRYIAD